MAETRTFAVLKFFKSGTTLASMKVRLANAAVESKNVSAEVTLADKPAKFHLKRSKLDLNYTQGGEKSFDLPNF